MDAALVSASEFHSFLLEKFLELALVLARFVPCFALRK
jgi:hypothetical protein